MIKEKLSEKIDSKRITENCEMSKYTTFRCGGCAKLFVICDTIEELSYTVSVCKALREEYMILGNGSNTLFADGGYDGVVIKLGEDFKSIDVFGDRIICGGAALIAYVSKIALANELSGLEFACGIPGSVGGAVYMNAGAYDYSMADCVESVISLTKDGDLLEYEAQELELSYRHSLFMGNGDIILRVTLSLREADKEDIEAQMQKYTEKRKASQPLSYPSAGSFFKRPEKGFSGALIEKAGLKGYSVGGAQVSDLHAGFIINKGDATASDIISLMKFVQNTVYEKSNVMLEPEVKIIGKY